MTELKLEFKRKDGTAKKFNSGKPFKVPNWTVVKHKNVLEEINKLPEEMGDDMKDIEFEYLTIYESLKEIDPKIEMDDIKNLHPMVLAELFDAVYSEGKYDIYFRSKGKKKRSE